MITRTAGNFVANLGEIFTGASTSKSNRWSMINFFDKVIAAHRSLQPQYWPGYGTARSLPGLPTDYKADGVSHFAGHVLLWKDSVIKYSDLNDFSMWIPVGATAGTGSVKVLSAFTQPAVNGNTPTIWVDTRPQSWVEEMFVRIDNAPLYDFYSVVSVSPSGGMTATLAGFTQMIPTNSDGYLLLIGEPSFVVDGYITLPTFNPLKVLSQSTGLSLANSLAAGFTVPFDTITQVTLSFTSEVLYKSGDVISLGDQFQTGLDCYVVDSVDGTTAVCRKLDQGTTVRPNYPTLPNSYESGTGVRLQPYVKVNNPSLTVISTGVAGDVVTETYGVVLKNLGLTGGTAPGNSIPADRSIQAIEANEAGEIVNAGSQISGVIYGIAEMGDQAFILKRRSIQSMQYTGKSAGTFSINREVGDEGPVGRHSWIVIGGDRMYFWGNREIYMYGGGSSITPIGQQASRQALDEMDETRRDEIFVVHREQDQQIMFVYPVRGDDNIRKIWIYNYQENSCTTDLYPSNIGDLSAGGHIDWRVGQKWNTTLGSWAVQEGTWEDKESFSNERLTVFCAEDYETKPTMLVTERLYNREGSGYRCTAETVAYDFDAPANWKYVDCVVINLSIKDLYNDNLKVTPGRPCRLWVQIGGQDSLDSEIRWTTPTWIEASGNGTSMPRINARMSGRFIRLRFYSENQPDMAWRISGWTIIARLGSTY